MRKTVLAMAAAVAVVIPAMASAAPYQNFTPNAGGTFGNSDPTTYPPLFNDVFNFVTNYERNATVDITSSYPIVNGKPDFSQNVNFVSNGVTLNSKIIPSVSTGQFEQRYLANFRIPAGVQNIVVRGSSSVNGMYQGILTLSGVPETSTWAMMIVGFGLIGGALRRRSTKARIAFA